MSERIHFGSIESSERGKGKGATILEKSNELGDSTGMTLDDLVDETQVPMDHKDELMEQFEKKKLSQTVIVPTDDQKVRNRLREIYEPMTLFGEGPAERRERLKNIITDRLLRGEDVDFEESSDEEEEVQTTEFFTYGIDELRTARKFILDYSIEKAQARLKLHQDELKVPFATRKRLRHDWYSGLRSFETKSLQFGDERPIGYCLFSKNSKLLATASWSGVTKIWSIPNSECLLSLKGHRDRVSGLDWHPQATLSQSPNAVNLVTGATDGGVHLWSLAQDTPIGKLDGHDMRVARLAFHPSGRFVGTASFDTSWRFWDVETERELLLQEGHSREVFAIGFQNDGALVATGGMDSIGRVWDLRTGRSIMVLKSHIKPILAIDWSPNGYQLATAGEDNTIRIWDIRAASCIYTIPAHKSSVTQVRYWHATDAFESKKYENWTINTINNNPEMEVDERHGDFDPECVNQPGDTLRRHLHDGSYIVSSSYDGTCKLWTDGDYKPIKSLSGIEGRVMCADLSGDGEYIATSLYDRSFKLHEKTLMIAYRNNTLNEEHTRSLNSIPRVMIMSTIAGASFGIGIGFTLSKFKKFKLWKTIPTVTLCTFGSSYLGNQFGYSLGYYRLNQVYQHDIIHHSERYQPSQQTHLELPLWLLVNSAYIKQNPPQTDPTPKQNPKKQDVLMLFAAAKAATIINSLKFSAIRLSFHFIIPMIITIEDLTFVLAYHSHKNSNSSVIPAASIIRELIKSKLHEQLRKSIINSHYPSLEIESNNDQQNTIIELKKKLTLSTLELNLLKSKNSVDIKRNSKIDDITKQARKKTLKQINAFQPPNDLTERYTYLEMIRTFNTYDNVPYEQLSLIHSILLDDSNAILQFSFKFINRHILKLKSLNTSTEYKVWIRDFDLMLSTHQKVHDRILEFLIIKLNDCNQDLRMSILSQHLNYFIHLIHIMNHEHFLIHLLELNSFNLLDPIAMFSHFIRVNIQRYFDIDATIMSLLKLIEKFMLDYYVFINLLEMLEQVIPLYKFRNVSPEIIGLVKSLNEQSIIGGACRWYLMSVLQQFLVDI
ncbi:hypothetical protein BC833DRAFT_617770 [Globomyces pollinis-pini]|nr:hypothetical protein BC833DRAFT_617770 [Globomyces pollinis-pini]